MRGHCIGGEVDGGGVVYFRKCEYYLRTIGCLGLRMCDFV